MFAALAFICLGLCLGILIMGVVGMLVEKIQDKDWVGMWQWFLILLFLLFVFFTVLHLSTGW